MVKLSNVLIVSCACAATAFSLERARVGSRAQIASISKSSNPAFARATTFLQSSEEPAPAEVVAAVPAPAAAVSLKDKIWNEQTKLSAYLAVWYLGNIYYNIYNKKACIALGKNAHGASNLHWMLSAVQLLVGVLFVVPLWLTGLRKVCWYIWHMA
jgi:solute carrier family 35 protein E1